MWLVKFDQSVLSGVVKVLFLEWCMKKVGVLSSYQNLSKPVPLESSQSRDHARTTLVSLESLLEKLSTCHPVFFLPRATRQVLFAEVQGFKSRVYKSSLWIVVLEVYEWHHSKALDHVILLVLVLFRWHVYSGSWERYKLLLSPVSSNTVVRFQDKKVWLNKV